MVVVCYSSAVKMPIPADGKSMLMTPDPYHTPGYSGYCPQIKYQFGQTFGKTTFKLLRDDAVTSSGKLVLADIRSSSAPAVLKELESKKLLVRSRTNSLGNQKLTDHMVPGYSGYVPRNENFFGTRYTKLCQLAVADFEKDFQRTTQKIKELRLVEAVQSGKLKKDSIPHLSPCRSSYVTPLKAIAPKAKPYLLRHPARSAESPLYMADNDVLKNFMSGYTGFVPRARPRHGAGYPIITHDALNEFTTDIARLKSLHNHPVTVHKPEVRIRDLKLLYPVESGIIPRYTGHIPGQRYRFGDTFGHSTVNAKCLHAGVSI